MEFATAAMKAHAKHSKRLLGSPENLELVTIGVLGTANIARKVVPAGGEVEGIKFEAIGSRSLEKAQAFAKEFDIPQAFGSYEEVLNCDQVDAVYIPLPTSMHLEWVTKAAKAKKHILCEKPCALDGDELAEMLKVCTENNVFFMDGVMFMHHERLATICKDLDSEKFGEYGPTNVMSTFCFPGAGDFFESNIRANPQLDALGALGDLGWYNIRFALFCFGWELPDTASGTIHMERNGVPIDVSGTLTWKSDKKLGPGGQPLTRSTSFHCSFSHCLQQFALVSGFGACLVLDDFVIARSNEEAFWKDESDVKFVTDKNGTKITSTAKVYKTDYCRQESDMLDCFRNCVNACKNGDSVPFWPGVSLATQLCVDAVLRSARNGSVETIVDPKGHLKEQSSA